VRNKINSLVIPAGSGMAIMAIKALKQDEDIIVMSADVNHLAPGLYLSHKSFLLPPFKDENFFSKLKELVRKEKVDVIIPALDTILLSFSEEAETFEELGAHVMVSEPETIRVTRDKWETYLHLKDTVSLPKSFVKKGSIDVDYPLFIKPRDGSGSKQTYVINSARELEFFYSYVRNPIIQEFLSGKEYTVDCLADMEGNLVACVPRERIETRDGISTKGLIVENAQLAEIGKAVSKKLRFRGPFFFQAKEDRCGNPKLTEINARIAGTMCPISFVEGNLHTVAVRLCMGDKVSLPRIRYGIYVSRYWEEIYLDESEIQAKLNRAYLNMS
jgi:carbamoyl-phosphate synthase large subunit